MNSACRMFACLRANHRHFRVDEEARHAKCAHEPGSRSRTRRSAELREPTVAAPTTARPMAVPSKPAFVPAINPSRRGVCTISTLPRPRGARSLMRSMVSPPALQYRSSSSSRRCSSADGRRPLLRHHGSVERDYPHPHTLPSERCVCVTVSMKGYHGDGMTHDKAATHGLHRRCGDDDRGKTLRENARRQLPCILYGAASLLSDGLRRKPLRLLHRPLLLSVRVNEAVAADKGGIDTASRAIAIPTQ